jgi:predicted DNA-binding protein YlxM (UPF0122 family)
MGKEEIQTAKIIRKLMIDKDLNMAKIALECGVSRQAIWAVITGKSESYLLRFAIAKMLGIDIKRIWK